MSLHAVCLLRLAHLWLLEPAQDTGPTWGWRRQAARTALCPFICSFPRQNKISFVHLQGSERKDNETQQKEGVEGEAGQHRRRHTADGVGTVVWLLGKGHAKE